MQEIQITIPKLEFSAVGAAGAYPDWVRALRGRSGAYVIAERQRSGEALIVYVGESHAGRLYETLTRHFQQWKRTKKWWLGKYGRLDSPGVTYQRGRCVVAVVLTPADVAAELQWQLIEQLRPRDNIIGQPDEQAEELEQVELDQIEPDDLEPVPF
jgi:alkanesulfonate monooxygenase SsuD/methylene tetrahydromethanopterin reductase-like flavin-dependent oxidoreductase (luciferase family)